MTELRVRTELMGLATQPPVVRAFAREDQILSRLWVQAGQAASAPMSTRRGNVVERFATLAEAWRERCNFVSSSTEMLMDPAYLEIIGLGEEVVPVLLAELRDNPDHWAWALQAITGANPVPVSDYGNIVRTSEAWVKWGRRRGYRV